MSRPSNIIIEAKTDTGFLEMSGQNYGASDDRMTTRVAVTFEWGKVEADLSGEARRVFGADLYAVWLRICEGMLDAEVRWMEEPGSEQYFEEMEAALSRENRP